MDRETTHLMSIPFKTLLNNPSTFVYSVMLDIKYSIYFRTGQSVNYQFLKNSLVMTVGR